MPPRRIAKRQCNGRGLNTGSCSLLCINERNNHCNGGCYRYLYKYRRTKNCVLCLSIFHIFGKIWCWLDRLNKILPQWMLSTCRFKDDRFNIWEKKAFPQLKSISRSTSLFFREYFGNNDATSVNSGILNRKSRIRISSSIFPINWEKGMNVVHTGVKYFGVSEIHITTFFNLC